DVDRDTINDHRPRVTRRHRTSAEAALSILGLETDQWARIRESWTVGRLPALQQFRCRFVAAAACKRDCAHATRPRHTWIGAVRQQHLEQFSDLIRNR